MKKKVTLLDRAKADLTTAEIMLKNSDDNVFVDIAAYHRLDAILEDLADEEVRKIVEDIEVSIDSWATTARYKATITASTKEVAVIIDVCKNLIKIVELRMSEQKASCSKKRPNQLEK